MPLASSSSSSPSSRLIIKALYRSLWRASKPFTAPNATAVPYACLLDRTGVEDPSWCWTKDPDRKQQEQQEQEQQQQQDTNLVQVTFRQLLKEVIATPTRDNHDDDDDDTDGSANNDDNTTRSSHLLQMRFPSHLYEETNDNNDRKNKNKQQQQQQQQHVSTASTNRLRNVLRREFRAHNNRDDNNSSNKSVSARLESSLRMELAFMALHKINAKLAWIQGLSSAASAATAPAPETENTTPTAIPTTTTTTTTATAIHDNDNDNDAITRKNRIPHVQRLSTQPSLTYLQPGTWLIAHPNLTGYFRRTVLIILDHVDDDDESSSTSSSTSSLSQNTSRIHRPRGTYGLIVNRLWETNDRCDFITFGDALPGQLPNDIDQAFGQHLVRDGGPVHATVQMLHRGQDDNDEENNKNNNNKEAYKAIGGHEIAVSTNPNNTSRNNHNNHVIKYQGDMHRAAAAVNTGNLPAADVSFFLGASSWATGQLESEVDRGFWLPCLAPPQWALDPLQKSLVMAKSNNNNNNNKSNNNDTDDKSDATISTVASSRANVEALLQEMDTFYIHMLASCGPHEAALAELVRYDTNEENPHRKPSDDFS